MRRFFKNGIYFLIQLALVIVLIAGTAVVCVHFTDSGKNGAKPKQEAAGSTPANEAGNLKMYVLDVGQGQAVLFVCDGHAMLIDGGDYDHGPGLVSYLKDLGIEKLDYLVASHYDADHAMGLVSVLYSDLHVSAVIAPAYQTDTGTYRAFWDAVEARNLQGIQPVTGAEYALGSAQVTVVSLTEDMNGLNEVENNSSVALRVTNGSHGFLVTGDAQKEAEEHMLSTGLPLSAAVYVAGHHGSAGSSTEEFLQAVSPKTAVISCGKDNDYGHPSRSTLDRFAARGIQVFRTDTDKTVIVVSDGEKLTFEKGPSIAGREEGAEPEGSDAHNAGEEK